MAYRTNILSILFFVGTITTAIAAGEASQELTAGEVLAFCEAGETSMPRMLCSMYTTGFVDGVVGGMRSVAATGFICLPDYFTSAEARDIFMRALRTHPELKRAPAASTMAGSLANSFPCKKK